MDPNTKPESGIYIARINYGEKLGELTILYLREYTVGLLDDRPHVIEPPTSSKIFLDGNDGDRYSWKLEKRLDLADVLAEKRDDPYAENCLREIARAIELEIDEESNLEWPETVEVAVTGVVTRIKKIDAWIRDHQNLTIVDLLDATANLTRAPHEKNAVETLVEHRTTTKVMDAAVAQVKDEHIDPRTSMQLAVGALKINQPLVARNILELALAEGK